ncbi:hypothetical protein [Macellibacteroides fermentans]|uniref:Uncharacterized protein n=1 Tax=Macellibacteroides fermentans TaxID=879969 RepID=A0A8E2D8F2_9PORP|nr:hypothetical protein [Macellibacteroides fermentans]NYI50274.1 hypothetical protein [Macellibacteroides fermentans]
MKKKIYGIVLINIMAMADGWNFNQRKKKVEVLNKVQLFFYNKQPLKI